MNQYKRVCIVCWYQLLILLAILLGFLPMEIIDVRL